MIYHARSYMYKGIATRSDENEQKSFTDQHETILFIARLTTRKRRRTIGTKRWKEHDVIVLLLSQSYCLKMSRGFRFSKQKTAANLLLYKRNILF